MLIVACLLPARSPAPCSKPSALFLNGLYRDISRINSFIHYLDDFLYVGSPASNICSILLGALQYIVYSFGVPLAAEKTERPTSPITFLGIVLDLQIAPVAVTVG